MKILKLIEGIDISEMRNIKDIEKIEVNNISSNSKDIKESGLFIAIRGEHFDGHNFIEEAIKRGALLALGEEDIKEFPYIMVPDSKRAYAFISSNYYNNPFREIKTVGVTGTNGKTTTVNLIGSILETLGEKAGIIGTLGARLGSEELVTQFTTPEQLLLAELYNRARNLGINKIVMEVSSQSLAQHRVDAVRFEAGIFTNLTQDHLDFHKDMESYFLSKRRLFEMVSEDKDGIMAINIDDDYGKRLVQEFSSYNLITYAIKNSAMIMAKDIEILPYGLSFNLLAEGRTFKVSSKLLGEVNVYNILSAISYIYGRKLPLDRAIEVIHNFQPVRGRLENVNLGQPFRVLIDFAHTPDALERVLKISKNFGKRVIVVFGCGGDRDRFKRPLMGNIATSLSDIAIITSDNPRSEDPMSIIEEIVKGVSRNNYIIKEDRREAIHYAIDIAEPEDVVLIAGKGHETYQIFKDKTVHFDDREVAIEAIKRRKNNAH